MKDFLKRFQDDISGATAIEYGLIAALIAVGIISAASLLGNELTNTYTSTATSVEDVNGWVDTNSGL